MLKSATAHWKNVGLQVIIPSVLWRDGEAFNPKLARLLAMIDDVSRCSTVSLVGTSAGASLAFNAYLERPNVVHKAVNVCGRLRAGNHHLRSLDTMARTSRAFRESVQHFEKQEDGISNALKQRLMTLRPFFGDELVPSDTAYLEGAHNRWVYSPEHMLSIYLSLRYPAAIIDFLR